MSSSAYRGRYQGLDLALPAMMGAYVLSQFYRSYVAVISSQLIAEFSFTPAQFGIFAGAFYFTFALAQLPLGIAFDRYGVRRPVMVCLAIGCMGALALPLTHDVRVATAAQVALGIGCAPLYMGLLNYVLKSGVGARQVRIVTVASAVGYVGAIAAGLPLAWSVNSMGWRASMGVVGGFMLLALACVVLTLREPPSPGQAGSMATGDARASALSLPARIGLIALFPVSFAVITGGTFRMSWGGPYLADLFQYGVVERGYVMTAASVLAMIWGLSIPRVLRHISVKGLVLCAFATGIAASLMLAIWPDSHPLLGAALVCVLFCVGSVHPLVMSQARSVVAPERLGLWLGLFNSMVFLGVAFCNSGFGWIAEHAVVDGVAQATMYGHLFLFTALVLAVGWLGALWSPAVARQ